MMADKNYRLEKEFGIISNRINSRNGDVTEIKLTKMGWFGKSAKYDLRSWLNGEPRGGVVIGGEAALRRLAELLNDLCSQLDEEEADED